mmetsp:Transcript_33438/g.94670  ORF Transcript_33438/g.94670 Transcript_33438/m.94670 type:complete len:270 (+) Transcript_33438:1865-2674(+)
MFATALVAAWRVEPLELHKHFAKQEGPPCFSRVCLICSDADRFAKALAAAPQHSLSSGFDIISNNASTGAGPTTCIAIACSGEIARLRSTRAAAWREPWVLTRSERTVHTASTPCRSTRFCRWLSIAVSALMLQVADSRTAGDTLVSAATWRSTGSSPGMLCRTVRSMERLEVRLWRIRAAARWRSCPGSVIKWTRTLRSGAWSRMASCPHSWNAMPSTIHTALPRSSSPRGVPAWCLPISSPSKSISLSYAAARALPRMTTAPASTAA